MNILKNSYFYFIYAIIFILLTTNYLTVEELIYEANQADIKSYQIIYDSSPNLPNQVDILQKHVSQRFLVPYLMGYLSQIISLDVEILFKSFGILFCLLICHTIVKISKLIELSNNEKIIYFSLFFFNPYLIRYYVFNYILLQDLIFLYFCFLFILFFLSNKDNLLIIIPTTALYLKQTSLALIITSLFYFFIKKRFISLIIIFLLSLLFAFHIKFISDKMTASSFPIGNVTNIFNYNFFDANEIKRFMLFLLFPLLSFLPLLIFSIGKIRIEKFNLIKFLFFLLPVAMMIGQPIMGGPDIGRNIIRLTSLSYPFILTFLIYLMDMRNILEKKVIFFPLIIFFHLWSMHPTFSIMKYFLN